MSGDENRTPADMTRRGFLKAGGAGAGVAAAATIVAATGAEATPSAAEPSAPSAGYRETAHVRRVYELSRF